jgi:hypothetical protein
LVYFRDRLEKTAERMIFDGIVQLLVELGWVKKGQATVDSTHIVGYVKAIAGWSVRWRRCARGWKIWHVTRDEKASRVLESTVGNLCREQSELAVKQNKASRRHRQCGQDMSDLLGGSVQRFPSSRT